MKREIKFRYRVRLNDKKIYKRIIYINELEIGLYEELKDMRTNILSRDEYTGMKDKNGNEIYENDIVKTNFGKGKIYYSYRWGSWFVEKQKQIGDIFDIEVIGNIYNNEGEI